MRLPQGSTSVKTATNPIQRSMGEIIVRSALEGAARQTSVSLSVKALAGQIGADTAAAMRSRSS